MKTNLEYIHGLTEKKYGPLETDKFYNIEDFNLKIKTIDGFEKIKNFVVKTGTLYTVKFETGEIVKCSSNHKFMARTGQINATELVANETKINSLSGELMVSSIDIGSSQNFYDIEVDSDAHTFVTADGIEHHNTGKTVTVEKMLHAAGKTDGEGYFKITGSATPSGIYRMMFEHKNDILLFDDSDSALNDQEGRNLFKAAADTNKRRKISWMKGGKSFVDPADYDEEGGDDTLPRYFDFTGKIIFISNMPLNKLDPDGALRTRGFIINVDPENEELYDFMGKICDKITLDVDYALSKAQRLEVVEVLRGRKVVSKSVNLRQLVRGMNTMAGILSQGGSETEWKKFVKLFA
jgi:hypothetical protein